MNINDCDFNRQFPGSKNEVRCDWCGEELDPEAEEPIVTHPSGQKQYLCNSDRCATRFHAYNRACESCGWWHTDAACPKCGTFVPGEGLPERS